VNFGYSPLLVAIFSCQTRDCLEARGAQTSLFKKILCKTTKNMFRNHDLVAPTRPLVKVTLGNATLIVASTERALFISAQTGKLVADGARCIGIPIFHTIDCAGRMISSQQNNSARSSITKASKPLALRSLRHVASAALGGCAQMQLRGYHLGAAAALEIRENADAAAAGIAD
jgi:hypothetical protein